MRTCRARTVLLEGSAPARPTVAGPSGLGVAPSVSVHGVVHVHTPCMQLSKPMQKPTDITALCPHREQAVHCGGSGHRGSAPSGPHFTGPYFGALDLRV